MNYDPKYYDPGGPTICARRLTSDMDTATPKARRHSLSEPLPAGAVHVVMLAPLYTPLEGPVGAAGMRARGIAVGLQGRGHRVTVICAMPRGVRPDPDGWCRDSSTPWVDLENLARAAGSEVGNARPVAAERLAAAHPDSLDCQPDSPGSLRDLGAGCRPCGAPRRVGGDSLIFSTGSRSSHVVARLARGNHPWIADLNDLWSRNPHSDAHHLRERYEQFWEHQTVGAATRLTTVNELMSEELERRYRSKGAVTAIFSGFEPSDFEGLTHTPSTSGPVRILFGGTVYPRLNLEPLYQALRSGKTAGWLSADRLQISFVGRLSERVTLEASEFGVVDLIEASGLIPRAGSCSKDLSPPTPCCCLCTKSTRTPCRCGSSSTSRPADRSSASARPTASRAS